MAFFNLTQLGPQNLFSTTSNLSDDQAASKFSSSESEQNPVGKGLSGAIHSCSKVMECTPPSREAVIDTTGDQTVSLYITDRVGKSTETTTSTSHVIAVYSSCNAVTQHGGSHTKYTELLHKHQRNPKGPMDLYRQPLTTSHMYGWWQSFEETPKQNWLQGPRHVHTNSEMTRFVDEMSQTNKEFTLY